MVLPPHKQVALGDTLDGRYTLRSVLGEGAYGTVFLAEHLYTKRSVAVKVLREEVLASDDAVKRFIREAQLASELDHPNCVRTHEFGKANTGQYYLVMERLDGETLGRRLDRVKRLPLFEAQEIMTQLLAALGAAHRKGIVHRDIKPDNIMLVRNDSGAEVVKLLDFGFAKRPNTLMEPNQDAITKTGLAMGTPEYIAPEQAQGGDIDQRTDLYSAGIILYRMIVGKPPFENDNPLDTVLDQIKKQPPAPRTVAPDAKIPGALEGLILRALCKKPEERYPDAFSFSAALNAAFHPTQNSMPATTEPMPATGRQSGAFTAFFEPVGTSEFWSEAAQGRWRQRPYLVRLAIVALAPSFIIFAALWKFFSAAPPAVNTLLDTPKTQPALVETKKDPPTKPATTQAEPTLEPASEPASEPVEELLLPVSGNFQEVRAAIDAKEISRAIALLEDMTTTEPENKAVWSLLTRLHASESHWEEALNSWQQVKKLDSSPNLPKGVLDRAVEDAFGKGKTAKVARRFVARAAPAQAGPKVEERLKNNSQRAKAAALLADIGKVKGYDPVPALLDELSSATTCEAKEPIATALSQFPKDNRALSALKEEAKTVKLLSKNRCMSKSLPAMIQKMEK